MAIGLVYQFNSGVIGSFDPPSARAAAKACMDRDAGLNPGSPETIQHPAGTTIFFGVDNDLTGVPDPTPVINTLKDYFHIIAQEFSQKGAPFKLGVYGSGDVCENIVGAGFATYGWIAGFSVGWTRTPEVYNETTAPHWHLFQNALEVPSDIAVDTDILNSRTGGIIGAFDKHGLIGALDDSAIRSTLRFVTAPQVTLFDTPGPGQTSLGMIAQNRMVSILQPEPEWSKVEHTFHVGNAGEAKQGYIKTQLLGSIDRMIVT